MISSIGSYYNYYTGNTMPAQTKVLSSDSESSISTSTTDTLELSEQAKASMQKAPPPPPISSESEDDESSTVDLSTLTEEQLTSLVDDGIITSEQMEKALKISENDEASSVQAPPPPPPPKSFEVDDDESSSVDLSTLTEEELLALVAEGTITSKQMEAELESREGSSESGEALSVQAPPPPPPPMSSESKDDESSTVDLSTLTEEQLTSLVDDGIITSKQMEKALKSSENDSNINQNFTATQKLGISAYAQQADYFSTSQF